MSGRRDGGGRRGEGYGKREDAGGRYMRCLAEERIIFKLNLSLIVTILSWNVFLTISDSYADSPSFPFRNTNEIKGLSISN